MNLSVDAAGDLEKLIGRHCDDGRKRIEGKNQSGRKTLSDDVNKEGGRRARGGLGKPCISRSGVGLSKKIKKKQQTQSRREKRKIYPAGIRKKLERR